MYLTENEILYYEMEIYHDENDVVYVESAEAAHDGRLYCDPHRKDLTIERNMGSTEGQTFCLRWNNHKANLVELLDILIKIEQYVDCTIVVDEQVQFKAHRVVLAVNSPYFQAILQDLPMDHCSILFPGVKEFEMRALLEYMYTGEVNVTQAEIPRIMEIAKQLEIKGLYDMTDDLRGKFEGKGQVPEERPSAFIPLHNNNSPMKASSLKTSPIISTSNNVTSAAQSSSSPPYNNFKPYQGLYSRSPVHQAERPPWPMASILESPVSHTGLLSRVYETAPDNNPLKRKKLSSISSMMSSSNDPTPILRNVLAQTNAPDSSQPLPLIPTSTPERRDDRASNHSNGNDYGNDKKFHHDDKPEDDQQSVNNDSRPYVPQQSQKPEWKRYKQYTKNDLDMAIEQVKQGKSALQAAKEFGVPARTLYDKAKKMGITTGRPMNRTMKRSPSNGGHNIPFPYGMSGTSFEGPPAENMTQFLQSSFNPMHSLIAAAVHANGIPSGLRRPGSIESLREEMNFGRPPSTGSLERESFGRMSFEPRRPDEREFKREFDLKRRSSAEHFPENYRRTPPSEERELRRPSDSEEFRPSPDEQNFRRPSPEGAYRPSMERQSSVESSHNNEPEEVEDLSMSRVKEDPSPGERHRSASPPMGVIVSPLSQVIQRLKQSPRELESS